jgi:hypothetical protein
MLSLLDPLAAYREDLEQSGRETLTEHDGATIEIALFLARLAQPSSDASDCRVLLEGAIADRLNEIGLAPGRPFSEPPEVDPSALFTRIRLLAERLDRVAGWRLATTLLSVAERAFAADDHERGRSMVIRARIARQCGSLDVAEQLGRQVRYLARRTRSHELFARGSMVMMAVNQERGNYPEMERWAHRALAHCIDDRLPLTTGAAKEALMIRAAVRGDFDTALIHGWQAYQQYAGLAEPEANILINISRLLVDSGRPSPAVRGFIAALARGPSVRLALFAWGGLSIAAAGIGDGELVELASNRILAMADLIPSPYAVGTALVSGAKARALAGMPNEPWVARASALAEQWGYHELSIEVDELRSGYDRTGRPIPAAPPTVTAAAIARTGTDVGGPELGEMIDALESMARIEDVYTVA